jgi:hypothetical protein
MIIHPVEKATDKEGVRLSARIEFEAGDAPAVDTLWYEFPGCDQAFFSGGAEGFATAMLLLAMARGEDVRVRGILSPRLLHGLNEYQRVFHAWFPGRFARVAIECEGLREPPSGDVPAGVGAAFSGGVDSSFTLLSHLPADADGARGAIDYALFIHGMDIPLYDEDTFVVASQRYQSQLAALDIRLLTARTNVRQFVDVLPWELMHGTALGSVALMADRLLRRLYIPASFPYTELAPWGSHPLTDPLMSTDTLEVLHDGCSARVDKIIKVANWAPARSWLRVCWERPDALQNCCRCYKCVLTMVSLDVAGHLEVCVTFPQTLERSQVSGLRLPEQELRETETIVLRAEAAGRHELASDLRAALRASRRRLALRRLRQRIGALKHAMSRRGRSGSSAEISSPPGPL